MRSCFLYLLPILVKFNNKPDDREKVVIILQDIVDILTKDMMVNCSRWGTSVVFTAILLYCYWWIFINRILDMINCSENDVSDGNIFFQDHPPELFASNFPTCAICFPLPDNVALKEQVNFDLHIWSWLCNYFFWEHRLARLNEYICCSLSKKKLWTFQLI